MSISVALPLHVATVEGKYQDVVNLIDESNIAVDQRDHEGTTALILACASNRPLIANFLLQRGANPSIQRNTGTGALFFACQGGFLELVDLLLRFNAPVSQASCEGGCPLLVACQNGHIGAFQRLLEHGGPDLLTARLRDGATSLFLAAQNGHLAMVKLLLSRGVDVEACRKDGTSPLYIAAQMGHLDVCVALLQAGANVNVAREDGSTPLFRAAQKGLGDVARLLLQASKPCLGLLANGTTVLHAATAVGDVPLCRYLTEQGADPSVRNKKGDSAFDLAQKMQHHELVSLFYSGIAAFSSARRNALLDDPPSASKETNKLGLASKWPCQMAKPYERCVEPGMRGRPRAVPNPSMAVNRNYMQPFRFPEQQQLFKRPHSQIGLAEQHLYHSPFSHLPPSPVPQVRLQHMPQQQPSQRLNHLQPHFLHPAGPPTHQLQQQYRLAQKPPQAPTSVTPAPYSHGVPRGTYPLGPPLHNRSRFFDG